MEFKIISLGGSLLFSEKDNFFQGKIATDYLLEFKKILKKEEKKEKRFIIVVGGGKLARFYQKELSKIKKIKEKELDWIGIFATWLNAQFLRLLFKEKTYPFIINKRPSQREIKEIRNSKFSFFFACGWEPGHSTDLVAVILAQEFNSKEIFNLTNIDYVYNKDPQKYKNAKPLKFISWKDYLSLIPQKWKPGLSLPFDPIASKLAKKFNLKVFILNGKDLKNFKKALNQEKFKGTLIG